VNAPYKKLCWTGTTWTADKSSADICTNAATRVLAFYQRRLDCNNLEGDATQLREADEVERKLRLAALQAERTEIFSFTRQHKISDELSRKLIRELDLAEARYR